MHKYLVQELRKEKIRPNIEMKYGCKLNRFPNKIPALANFSRQIMSPVAAPPLPKWAVAICMSTTNIHNTQLSYTLLRHKNKIANLCLFFYFLTFEKADCPVFALLVGWSVGRLVG